MCKATWREHCRRDGPLSGVVLKSAGLMGRALAGPSAQSVTPAQHTRSCRLLSRHAGLAPCAGLELNFGDETMSEVSACRILRSSQKAPQKLTFSDLPDLTSSLLSCAYN